MLTMLMIFVLAMDNQWVVSPLVWILLGFGLLWKLWSAMIKAMIELDK